MHKAAVIELSPEEQSVLESWVRASTTERRLADRARLVLAAAEGMGTNGIARRCGVRPATVSKSRVRFARDRLARLKDADRSGRPVMYGPEGEKRILSALDTDPAAGYAQWSAPLLAKRVGGTSKDYVWRVLRKHKVALQRRRKWRISTDPEFAAKAADIVGL